LTKGFDVVIGLVLSLAALFIWIYRMIVTSDTPTIVTFKQFIVFMSVTLLYIITEVVYIKKTESYILNLIFLTFPCIIWILTLNDILPDGYDRFDTICVIIGSGSVIFVFLYCLYKVTKKIYEKR